MTCAYDERLLWPQIYRLAGKHELQLLQQRHGVVLEEGQEAVEHGQEGVQVGEAVVLTDHQGAQVVADAEEAALGAVCAQLTVRLQSGEM